MVVITYLQILSFNNEHGIIAKDLLSNDVGRSLALSTYILFPLLHLMLLFYTNYIKYTYYILSG